MPLPLNPPISSNDIRAEFNGPAVFDITMYYRGGPLVPDTVRNDKIPERGPISILDFLGSSK